MRDEREQVRPNEFVLRRIPKAWCDPSLAEPVLRVAFEPRKRDLDGLSVFREDLVTAAELATTGLQTGVYYVTRLRVHDIIQLGLTVVSDPQSDQPPGHAVIPELSFAEMKKDKKKSKGLQRALAELAGRSIAHVPD